VNVNLFRSVSGTALAIAAAAVNVDAAPLPSDQHAIYTFDIPAGTLDTAAAAFERITGVRVVFDEPALAVISSAGVSGTMSAAHAMEQLLAGTSMKASFAPGMVRISVATISEFVEVTSETLASSPKYTAPLRDIPQTLVVIPSAVIESQGVTTLRDALRNTPGITLTAGEGGTAPGDNVLIRGFSARNDVYIDGARDTGVTSRDTFNIESVEVAKGPSSVTTGRGSTGGSVNLVTKAANLSDSSEIRLAAGNADQKRGTIDVNHRLSDSIAFRINAMWQDSGVPGRDVVTQHGWGFAPSIGFGIGKATTLTMGYQRLDQDNVPDYGLPGTLPDAANAAGVTVEDLDFSNFYGLASRDYEKMTSDVATATVEHRFSATTSLRNLTRYGRNYLDRVVTPPRAASAANAAADPGYDAAIAQVRRTDTKYQYRDDRTATNVTDLRTSFATGAIDHDAVAGLELAADRQPSHSATDLFTNGRPPVTDLFHPDPYRGYAPAIAPTGAASTARAHSAAIYGFDTVKISEALQFDLGLRWDRIDVDYETISAAGVAAQFGRIDKAISGRSGVVIKPTQRLSVYGAYSTSFNPSYDGSFGLTLAATGVNNAALPPERSHNLEAGSKLEIRRGLMATIALFRTDKTNARTTDTATGATILAGDQLVQGVELGLSGNVTPEWAIFTGLALMNGTIRESHVAAEVDKQLSYVPKQSFNLWTTYRLPANLTLGGGTQFTGGYYFANTNALTSANAAAIQRLTSYWLVTAMGSYRVNAHVELQLNLTNLANARYVERGYSGHFIPGASRAILFTPVIRF
jgi:catecholate siderophore receptor